MSEVLSVLISAVGGQGGAVLTEWLTRAAVREGYPVQSTSIPGVAQRTGSTIYYFELYPVPEAQLGGRRPHFALYPSPGHVDSVLAAEFLELGRTIEQGFVSPDRTVSIASTHRLYSIHEKTPVGDGVFPRGELERLARQFSKRFIGFDALALARQVGMGQEVNAILLGALAAAGILPIQTETFVAAIESHGVAVATNVKAFRAGFECVRSGSFEAGSPPPHESWEEFNRARAAGLGRRGAEFLTLMDEVERDFPKALFRTLGEAVARLVDYQDARYARLFLGWVAEVKTLDRDGDWRLTERYARQLALWMAYEDGIRVAQYKSRPERFRRIARENAATGDQLVVVTDYLKPDIDEITGILPRILIGPFARWAEKRWPGEGKPTFAQHVRTTTALGYLRLWLLARLSPLRPASWRYAKEHAVIAKYREAVARCAALNPELGEAVAHLARIIKGYGQVRRRSLAAFERVLGEILYPLVELDRRRGIGYRLSRAAVEKARLLLLASPDGIDAALAVARETLAAGEASDYESMVTRITAVPVGPAA
jgi:indolepyruvate ferredoxin oxidoreductase beta subunit